MASKKISLTIDSEFWDSPEYFGLATGKSFEHGSRGCWELLDLFHRTEVKTTFFVASEFARRHPDLVHEMIRRGHEVGSHTHSHVRMNGQGSEFAFSEIDNSRRFLESTFGISVKGYRAAGN